MESCWKRKAEWSRRRKWMRKKTGSTWQLRLRNSCLASFLESPDVNFTRVYWNFMCLRRCKSWSFIHFSYLILDSEHRRDRFFILLKFSLTAIWRCWIFQIQKASKCYSVKSLSFFAENWLGEFAINSLWEHEGQFLKWNAAEFCRLFLPRQFTKNILSPILFRVRML